MNGKVNLLLIAMLVVSSSSLHPIILVPGNGGNQLEARLTKTYKPSNPFCSRKWNPIVKDKDGWFRLWFEPTVLLSPFTKCFAERMTLYFDKGLDDFRNAPGVETRVPHFGSTNSLRYLDPSLKHITSYMASLVDSLEEIGYVDGETLFGAPYDFRYGLANAGHPCEIGSKFLKELNHLIENASISNGGKPVIIVSHSLGGLFVLQLLNRNPLSWRERYIKHFIALSAPWGGTVVEMLTFASGSTLGVPLVDPLLVREEQRSSESNLWLFPNPFLFNQEKSLVVTPYDTYTASDTVKFLDDIGYSEGVYPYTSRILPLMEQLTAPLVPVTCIIGKGVKTAETLIYGENGFDEQPEIVYGDGDGTVNLVSLLALESLWRSEKNQALKLISISGVDHTDILKNEVALVEITREINVINSQDTSMILLNRID
ncbi:hypothetical protein ACFE04_004560 [Oxalis oulophora]